MRDSKAPLRETSVE